MSDGTEVESGQVAEVEGKGADPAKTVETPEFTKAQVEAIIRERLTKEKGKQEEAARKAREEAESKALAEQGKYKELHDAAAAKLTELEPFKERAERLEAVLLKRWDAEKKDVPDFVLALLESKPVDERLDYITDNRDKWSKTPVPNLNGAGGGKGALDPKEREAEIKQRFNLK